MAGRLADLKKKSSQKEEKNMCPPFNNPSNKVENPISRTVGTSGERLPIYSD